MIARAPIWPVEARGVMPATVTHEFAAFAGHAHPAILEGHFCRATWVVGRAAFEMERDTFRRLQADGHYGWVLIKEGFTVTPMEPPRRKGVLRG